MNAIRSGIPWMEDGSRIHDAATVGRVASSRRASSRSSVINRSGAGPSGSAQVALSSLNKPQKQSDG